MPTKRKTAKSTTPDQNEHDDAEAVSAFMSGLEHPMKAVMEAVRVTILEADRAITEGIKWNTASFYCQGWFATIGVRAKTGVQIVLHHGAKTRGDSTLSETIDDPSHLLNWLAKDRATVTFSSATDFQSRRGAFKKIIKQWVKHHVHMAEAA